MKKLSYLCAIPFLLLCSCGGDDSGTEIPKEPRYTLSGTVSAPGYMMSSGYLSDSSLEGQIVPKDAEISGFLNRPEGEVSDEYRVELAEGQSIQLFIADPKADLDLFLSDDNGNLLQASQGAKGVEAVQASSPGLQTVTVTAESGASSYLLRMNGGKGHSPTLGITQDFVPGEVIVRYKEENPSDATPPLRGLLRKGGGKGRGILFEIPAMLPSLSKDESSHPLIDESRPDIRRKMETIRVLKRLQRDPTLQYAEPNYRLRTHFLPNDNFYPDYQSHWASLIELPEAWDTTMGVPETVVAVVDSGVLFGHPDLNSNLLDGYDFIADSRTSGDGNGIDPDPTDAIDGSYHGTHVAGIIAAATNNTQGIAGVAGNVRILPVRALAGEDGTYHDIAQAIRYAAGLTNDSGILPEQAAAVINMSFGGDYASEDLRTACAEAREAGAILVSAAGNNSSAMSTYPAAYDEVISVSAVNAEKQLAAYSNSGPQIALAAPGGEENDGILSTSWDRTQNVFDYVWMHGTSMAAPHASGVIALMHSLAPSLTPDDVDTLLAAGALTEDLGLPGWDASFGYGLINARKAVLEAQQLSLQTGPVSPSLLTATPAALAFSSSKTELSLQLQSTGEDNIRSVTSLDPWVTVRAVSAEPETGLGKYTVSVNRTEMLYGEHSSEIVVDSSGGTLRVPVTVTRELVSEDTVYMVLTENSGKTVAQIHSQLGKNGIPFTFADLSAGKYRLFAGTDADGDMKLCGPGELCGMYPDPLTRKGFLLDANRTGLEISLNLMRPEESLPYGITLPTRLK